MGGQGCTSAVDIYSFGIVSRASGPAAAAAALPFPLLSHRCIS